MSPLPVACSNHLPLIDPMLSCGADAQYVPIIGPGSSLSATDHQHPGLGPSLGATVEQRQVTVTSPGPSRGTTIDSDKCSHGNESESLPSRVQSPRPVTGKDAPSRRSGHMAPPALNHWHDQHLDIQPGDSIESHQPRHLRYDPTITQNQTVR